MRAFPLAVAAVVVGALVGGASAYWSVGRDPVGVDLTALGSSGQQATGFPRFHVESMTYDFGTMQRGTTREHAFQVTNQGTEPLQVKVQSTTCKCTVGDVEGGPIGPGESVDVTLTWTAKSDPGPFRQTATLTTNDPRASRVELTVEGTVTDVTGVEPREWFFDKLTVGEERTESVYVMGYQDHPLQIDAARIEHAESESLYRIDLVEVPREDLPDPEATSGYRVDVTPQGNLPLGPIYDWVLLETNLEMAEEFRVPILGTVVGDIEIRGPGAWNDVTSAVHFGDVQSEEGAEVRLFLSVRGEHADTIEFEVAETDPEELEIEFGEPQSLRPGAVRVPMTVRIPPGLPPAIRNGTAQGEAGRVTLKTNHPLSPELSFGVRYVIKRASITR